MARIPEPQEGLVFRYEYVRFEDAGHVDHGKERPCCILLTLRAGEVLEGLIRVEEDGGSPVRYVAESGDVAIVLIQSDPPGKGQVGIKLEPEYKRALGMRDTDDSYVIVSEINVSKWPPLGIRPVPGRGGRWSYGKLPAPKLGQVAKAFLKVRELRGIRTYVREP